MSYDPRRPKYVSPYLDQLAGPNEQHGEGGDCLSPFCNYEFTPEDEAESYNGILNCPQCGFNNDMNEMHKPVGAPGGSTRAGLTLKEMGDIGHTVVLRLGDLPNVGAINPAGDSYHHPIDVVVQGQGGNYGCEIKTNHSQAQERFKVGGRDERLAKIQYCQQNGLKPALIGVRLNFFTSMAYVFFREGLTDTWMGNSQMQHVGTFNFEDLNPFKANDPKIQAMAVENAHLPDQSDEDEFAGVFSSRNDENPVIGTHLTGRIVHGDDQPRDEEGRFTFKHDHKEVKIVDKKGKHTHTARRCIHCGHLNAFPSDKPRGREECSTCGQDPDRSLRLAKIVLADSSADQVAAQLGFNFQGRTGKGHRKYTMEDPNGTVHTVIAGQGGPHAAQMDQLDAQMTKQRMTRCLNGQCNHITTPALPEVVEDDPFVVRAGSVVTVDGEQKFVSEIDGGLALVFDVTTGNEDIVPVFDLQQKASWITHDDPGDMHDPWEASVSSQETRTALAISEDDPDYLFVYYMSELHVVQYEGIRRFEDMLEALLNRFGDTMDKIHGGPKPEDVAAGEIFVNSDVYDIKEIKHLQLCPLELREEAERAIEAWYDELSEDEWNEEHPEESEWFTNMTVTTVTPISTGVAVPGDMVIYTNGSGNTTSFTIT